MINKIGNSRLSKPDLNTKGEISAVQPKINPILAILEPNAFPTANPEFPCEEAIAETSISGADVPSPTIVKPINKGDTPSFLAIDAVPTTNLSAATTNTINPTSKAIKLSNIISLNKVFNTPVFQNPIVKYRLFLHYAIFIPTPPKPFYSQYFIDNRLT